jgi:beta-phosphoglucomutase
MKTLNQGAVEAVIFDLDGVIVSTDEFHYLAWKMVAVQEDIPFNREINEQLRGISRMESLEIVLQNAKRIYLQDEKESLAESKNKYYKRLIAGLTADDILPGAIEFLKDLKSKGIKTAVASSSRNAPFILGRIGLDGFFDVIVSGNDIKKSKPDPEVFLLAAKGLNIDASHCLVVEDAFAGIDAAIAGGMLSLGVGYASGYEKADFRAESLASISVNDII